MAFEVRKFQINITGDTVLQMPKDSLIYKWGVQRDKICCWVRIDKEQVEMEKRIFRIYGTGHPIEELPYAQDYEDTLIMGNLQEYVVHIFEIITWGKDL